MSDRGIISTLALATVAACAVIIALWYVVCTLYTGPEIIEWAGLLLFVIPSTSFIWLSLPKLIRRYTSPLRSDEREEAVPVQDQTPVAVHERTQKEILADLAADFDPVEQEWWRTQVAELADSP